MDTLGARLKRAREERGVTLRQIAAVTKISVSALEALERNDFGRLPGGIFSRAFVRAYAAEVGLDPEATVREFVAEAGAAEEERAAVGPVRDAPPEDREFLERQRRAGRFLRIVLIVAAVVAAGLLLWQLRGTGAATGPAAGISLPDPGPGPATFEAPPPPDPAPPAPADPLVITVELTGPCWLRVTADGDVLLERMASAGERHEFRAAREVTLQAGNAAAIRWTVNGQPARPLGGRGDVRQVRVTPESASDFVR